MWIGLEEKSVPEKKFEDIPKDALKLRNYTLHPKVANLEEVLNLIKNSFKREYYE